MLSQLARSVAFSFLGALLLSSQVFAEDATSIVMGAIDGLQRVEIKNGDTSRQGQTGESIKAGDQVILPDNVTVTLWIPDGGTLVLGQKSRVVIVTSPYSPQLVNLQAGTVRGTFAKIQKKVDETSSGFRFILRTPTAVLGVHGTDFVVSVNDDSQVVDFHSIEGTVEVARTVESLVANDSVKLQSRETLQSTPEKIQKKHFYYVPQFLKDLEKTVPGLSKKQKLNAPGIQQ